MKTIYELNEKDIVSIVAERFYTKQILLLYRIVE